MAGGNVGNLNITITGNNAGLKGALADSRADVGKTAGFFRNAFSTGVGMVGASVFTGLTSGAIDFGKGLLMANANAEMLKTTLEIATGSADRAKFVFAEMQKMAAATPFEFSELTAGAAKIESFGQDSTKVMGMIGDTAAGTMKSIDQVTSAYLDAGMGQFIRLQELGIDAAIVGDNVRLKWVENGKEMVKEVDKNNGLLIQSTVASIWNSKYDGAMKKQSKTFLGQWSTLKDNWNLTMQRMSGGLFDFFKGGLTEANQFFDLFNRKLGQGFDPVHAALSALHVTLDQVFGKRAGDAIDATLRDIVDGVGAVGGAVVELGGDLLRGDFGEFFADLGGDLRSLAAAGIDLGNVAVDVGRWVLSDGIPDLWDWFERQIGVTEGGKFIGRGDGTEQAGTVTLTDIVVNVAGWAAGEISDLWSWVMKQIGVTDGGQFIGRGDGTEQAGAVTLSDIAVNVASWAAGEIVDLGGWIQDQIDALAPGLTAEIREWKLILFGPDKVEAAPSAPAETKRDIEWLTDGWNITKVAVGWTADAVVEGAEIRAGHVETLYQFIKRWADGQETINVPFTNWELNLLAWRDIKWDAGFGDSEPNFAVNVYNWLQGWVSGQESISLPFSDWDLKLLAWKDIQWDAGIPDKVGAIKAKIEELLDGLGDITVTFPGNVTMTLGLPSLDGLPSWNDIFNGIWDHLKSLGDISVPWPNNFTVDFGLTGDTPSGDITDTTGVPGIGGGAGPMPAPRPPQAAPEKPQVVTTVFNADTGPLAKAYTDSMTWLKVFDDANPIATFGGDTGPAAMAFTSAYGWGATFDGTVFEATFSIDTSPVLRAVEVVRTSVQEIRDLLPSSPAKKGPLSGRLPTFSWLADDIVSTMGRATGAVRYGAQNLAQSLRWRSPDIAVERGKSSGEAGAGRPLHVHIEGNVYGEEDFVRRLTEADAEAARIYYAGLGM